jgi:hypothetical protein
MIFMVMLIIPTAVHFVTAAKPAAPPANPGLYRDIAALEIEVFGRTQENGGPPYYEEGIVSLAPVMPDVFSPEYQNAVYGYGFIDEDGRPW